MRGAGGRGPGSKSHQQAQKDQKLRVKGLRLHGMLRFTFGPPGAFSVVCLFPVYNLQMPDCTRLLIAIMMNTY